MRTILATMLLIGICAGQTTTPVSTDLNTVMMQSTFKIVGSNAMGTGFIIGRPVPNSNQLAYVLVTAAHVLRDMNTENVFLILRQQDAHQHWQEIQVPIQIRSGGRPLWVQHPTADVAVLYVGLPSGAVPTIVPEALLADDRDLSEYEVHPGDELNVLGYPLGVSGPGGFPILRSGKIASYPLVPSRDNPYFFLDFRVFKGNSGGPAYLVSDTRPYKGATHIGTVRMILGVVSEEMSVTEQVQELYESRSQTYPLSLAKIVPSAFIKETIDMLPVPREQSPQPH